MPISLGNHRRVAFIAVSLSTVLAVAVLALLTGNGAISLVWAIWLTILVLVVSLTFWAWLARSGGRLISPANAGQCVQASVHPLDEIQFTVYRPKTVQPGEWYPMLAFAHLGERRPDAPKDEPDPIARVRAQAEQFLGSSASDFRDISVDSRQAVPK
jgi:hypothetical protein